jgi:hypothetical protein
MKCFITEIDKILVVIATFSGWSFNEINTQKCFALRNGRGLLPLSACKVQPLHAMVFKCLLAWVSWEYEEQWGKGLISETAGQ